MYFSIFVPGDEIVGAGEVLDPGEILNQVVFPGHNALVCLNCILSDVGLSRYAKTSGKNQGFLSINKVGFVVLISSIYVSMNYSQNQFKISIVSSLSCKS